MCDDMKPTPPSTYEEWLVYSNISTWPDDPDVVHDTSWLDVDIGTYSELSSEIKKNAPFQVDNLDDILSDVDILVDKVDEFYQCFFGEKSSSSGAVDDIGYNVVEQNNEANYATFNDRRGSNKQTSNPESLKSRNIELAVFPGFQPCEMTILPAAIEAPKLLNNISRLQNFSNTFRKIWKRFFLSDASVCILQDAFWWIFLDWTNKSFGNNEEQVIKTKLFDRMSNNFVYLFISIPFHAKDHFFEFYPNCLSQALYSAFFSAFPLSTARFNFEFRKYLVDLIYEWASGICPLEHVILKNWNLEYLETQNKFSHDFFDDSVQGLKSELSFDEATFLDISRSGGGEIISGMLSPTKNKRCHQVTVDDKLNRVAFNVFGQGPLIKHFLDSKHLQKEEEILTKVVTRVERTYKKKTDIQSYSDVIANQKVQSARREKEYVSKTSQISSDLRHSRKKNLKEIQQMVKLHNNVVKKHEDLKVLSQRIIDMMANTDLEITGKVFMSEI